MVDLKIEAGAVNDLPIDMSWVIPVRSWIISVRARTCPTCTHACARQDAYRTPALLSLSFFKKNTTI